MFSLDKRNIRIAISATCNFECVYCGGNKKRTANKPGAMEDFRSKPLNNGLVSTDIYIRIISALYKAGFKGMTLTGGEPLLNPDWNKIVSESKKIGMERIGLTTNGSHLKQYLNKNKKLPIGLSLITLSLDTVNEERFRQITKTGDLNEVLDSLKFIKKRYPKIKIRANKVMLRSELNNLIEYINFCENSKTIEEINLLNLILKDTKNKKYFEKEFISANEITAFLKNKLKYDFIMDSKYEFITKSKAGLNIIIKDTNQTLRNKNCDNCPIYCQEGFYTLRVSTDGTIRPCPDYKNKLPFINGPEELKKGQLEKKIKSIVDEMEKTEQKNTFNVFFKKYGIKLDKK